MFRIGQGAWAQAWPHPIASVTLDKLLTLCSLTSTSIL